MLLSLLCHFGLLCMQLATVYVNAQKSGLLKDTKFCDHLQERQDVLYARALISVSTSCLCSLCVRSIANAPRNLIKASRVL